MTLAQGLYEGLAIGPDGVVGLITYMRTDSTRVAEDAQRETLEFISTTYGQQYAPEKPNVYRSKKSAQDAHEAIRPTSTLRTPTRSMPIWTGITRASINSFGHALWPVRCGRRSSMSPLPTSRPVSMG